MKKHYYWKQTESNTKYYDTGKMNSLPLEIFRGGDCLKHDVEVEYHFQIALHSEQVALHFEFLELVMILLYYSALLRGMPGVQSLSTAPWN